MVKNCIHFLFLIRNIISYYKTLFFYFLRYNYTAYDYAVLVYLYLQFFLFIYLYLVIKDDKINPLKLNFLLF